ncbi:MAG: Y-family DNA polymerase [Bacteroidales bacterium]|nr:Y-family DNA polymerase [Bacteroidales bacterium]
MFALVDCNNFFASAERVFHPELRNRPVCVLSNNDGCVVSLTNEAKALGIKRGDPLFKIREIVDKKNVAVFSSNYVLYAGMSSRVMETLSQTVPDIEIYSIDEAFLPLDGLSNEKALDSMRALAKRVLKWTGIPVSIGIAPTKTLAKVAAKYAKKYAGYHNVCFIDTDEKRNKALLNFPIEDVWGIGRQSVKKLACYGVTTARDFLCKEEDWVKRNFSVTGLRTWLELRGVSCIESSEITEKQTICVSRSFGNSVCEWDELRESVANFAADVARKLRKQHSVANIITVFIRTDRFNTRQPQYSNALSLNMMVPTSDTAEIITMAHKLLQSIFRKGIAYKKAGVIASSIIADTGIQQNLFDTVPNREKRDKLNQVMDRLNEKNGVSTIKFAIQECGTSKWVSKNEFKSQNYLTDIKELIQVKLK